MTPKKKCLRCGGTSLEPGALQSTGQVYFRAENTKFFTLRTSEVLVKANVCIDCGTIDLVGNVRKGQTLVGRASPV